MASHYTQGSKTILHDFGGVLGRPLDTFFLGSHNFMVMALGSCVKCPKRGAIWPLKCDKKWLEAGPSSWLGPGKINCIPKGAQEVDFSRTNVSVRGIIQGTSMHSNPKGDVIVSSKCGHLKRLWFFFEVKVYIQKGALAKAQRSFWQHFCYFHLIHIFVHCCHMVIVLDDSFVYSC